VTVSSVSSRAGKATTAPTFRAGGRIPSAAGSPADGGSAATPGRSDALPWPVTLFLVSLTIPWIVPLGPLNMPTYRFVLLLTLPSSFLAWTGGKAGPIRTEDIAFMLFCAWAAISLFIAHGGAAIETAGTTFIDTMGAYMLARCFVRNAEQFRRAVLLAVKLIVILLPFAIYEWITGNKPLLDIFGVIFPTVDVTKMTPRMGFWRVQGPFSHSILYGGFCGSFLALTAAVVRPGLMRGLTVGAVGLAAVLSMSSAPMAGVVVQSALMTWNKVLGSIEARWKLLWALVFACYLVIEFGSNQTPVNFYISYFTFDPQSGWYRTQIWEWGSLSVANHPLFGIGLGDWVRPSFMAGDSVDNFWLLTAMRFGLPAFLLFAAACLAIWLPLARKNKLPGEILPYRTAYLICMTSVALVGTTVHYWGSSYVSIMFLIGIGVWMLDVPAAVGEPRPSASDPSGGTQSRRPARRTANIRGRPLVRSPGETAGPFSRIDS